MKPVRFAHQRIGLLTRHGKQRIIAPLMDRHLGARLVHTDDFDTDSLGSFSGETPRTMSALECATHKARLACELTGQANLLPEFRFITTGRHVAGWLD